MSTAGDQARINADLKAGVAKWVRGLCTSIDAGAATTVVNISGGLQTMPILGWPTVGREVWVLYAGTQPVCVGPVPKAPWGVVEELPDDGLVLIRGDDSSAYRIPYADSLTLEVGNRVVMDWAAGIVIAEPAAEAEEGNPTGPPGQAQQEITKTFFPIDSGTWGSSWFTDRVFSGDSSLGAFFYDNIAGNIPPDAEILFVSVYIDAIQTTGGAPTLGVHSQTGKAGPPDTTGAIPIAGGTGDKELPLDFGRVLQSGVAKGLGTFHGGYHIWSPANVNNSGALTIRYRTAA